MGVAHPRFTIAAVAPSGEEFDFNVVEANSAVTPETTTYSVNGGPPLPVRDLGVKFLVSDPHNGEDSGGDMHGFLFIAVDENTGQVNGISKVGDEKPMNIAQLGDDVVTVTVADEFTPPEWSCGVSGSFAENFMHMQSDDEGIPPDEGITSVPLPHFLTGAKRNQFGHRDLMENNQGFMNHDHQHHHGEDNHAHENHSGHLHLRSSEMNVNTVATLVNSLSDQLNTQPSGTYEKHKALSHSCSHQVDLFIEIDDEFVIESGGGDLDQAHQYVNILITAVSSIFERQIDTHLHVQHIAKTNFYDSSDTIQAALEVMQQTYKSVPWHFPGINLHHGLLGRHFGGGGGIAYVGVVCDSQYGFGLSTQMSGSFESIDASALWDFIVVAHELGHNFGSWHTHDTTTGYDPPVDTCGIKQSDGSWTCSNELPLDGSATIMGYCHICPGGLSNVGYTFGGQWDKGDIHDISNWKNSNLAGAVSFEPRRVPKTMWEHVSSKGTCVSADCTQDEDCFDGDSCTEDTCNAGQCNNTLKNDCFTLSAPVCVGTCWIPRGLMFDISTMSNNILLHGLSFRMYSSSGDVSSNVTVYTAPGAYGDIYNDPDSWKEIHSTQIVTKAWSYVSLDFKGVAINSKSTQALYVSSSTSDSFIASKESENPVASDANLNIHTPARYVFGPFGDGTSEPNGESISWEGNITYSLQASCSQDSDCSDENSCTVDRCDLSSGTCHNSMLSNCCGNDVCEVNEEECNADCGPWNLDAPLCNTYGNGKCYTPKGMMFDVTATVGISMLGISIIHNKGTNINVDFYTVQGSFDDLYLDPLSWDFLGSWSTVSLDQTRWLSIPIRQTEIQAGSTQSFYIVTSSSVTSSENDGGIFCGGLPADVVADEQIEIRSPARVFPNSEPFSDPSYDRYSFQGGIKYRATAVSEPTPSPSDMSTMSPTLNPTLIRSLRPSISAQPSTGISSHPSSQPSRDPSSQPSSRPSISTVPSSMENFDPSSQPSSQPSLSDQPSSIPSSSSESSISTGPSSDPSGHPSVSDLPTSQPPSQPSTHPSTIIRTSDAPSASSMPTKKNSEVPTTQSPFSAPIPVKWFMDWDILSCRQHCNGNLPCGGKPELVELYDTLLACCTDSFGSSADGLVQQCLVASLITSGPTAVPTAPSDLKSVFNN